MGGMNESNFDSGRRVDANCYDVQRRFGPGEESKSELLDRPLHDTMQQERWPASILWRLLHKADKPTQVGWAVLTN